MGILDEAIREHLELKRAHGADDSELKQLEDQAFGPPERPGAAGAAPDGASDAAADPAAAAPPDPAAEAPTEFMSQPDLGGDKSGDLEDAGPGQESAPPPRREPAAGMADIQEPPVKVEEEPAEEAPAAEQEEAPAAEQDEDEPVSEEQPAAEHETIPAPEEGSPGSHTTAERHAIADQPTEMFDVEEELAAAEVPAPPDEDLVAEEISEARLGPVEPLTPPPAPAPADDEDEDDDDFFSEQRLSDELDQALEAPIDREPDPVSDEHEVVREPTDEHEAVAEPTEVHEAQQPEKRGGEEDVLEETPDFLEETPEDDQLWFEQKPPKDFDFDD